MNSLSEMDLNNLKVLIVILDLFLLALVITSLATKGSLLHTILLNYSDFVDGDVDYGPSKMLLNTFVFDIIFAVACLFLPLVIYKKPDYSGIYKIGLYVFFIGRFVVGVLFLTAGDNYFKDADPGAWIYEVIFDSFGICAEVIFSCYLSKLCDILIPPEENSETTLNPNVHQNPIQNPELKIKAVL